jgi:DNA polymerase III alpha subunit
MIIPLHLPSHWSLARGVASPAELVAQASSWQLPALALTDLENLCGAVEFHHRCSAAGIRPILGIELRAGFVAAGAGGRTGPRRGRLVLLARNSGGYRSLCRIVSRRRTGALLKPLGDPVPDVVAAPDGLFALTDDPFALERLLAAGFPRRFARLLWVRPRYDAREEGRVLAAASRLGVPLVADLDPVFLAGGDRRFLRLRLAIGRRVPLDAVAIPPYRQLLPPRSAAALFADHPAAIRESARVAEACGVDVLPSGAPFPLPDLLPGETVESRVTGIARAALDRVRAEGRMQAEAYDIRLERELAVVEATGLGPWFLGIVEIVEFARSRRIEAIARGSAGGSLLGHLLGLGPVDPVENGLLFERFLRLGRSSPPDIDLDLPSRRREEVIEWVLRRWEGHAAPVGSHACFGARSARGETARALGLAEDGIDLPSEAARLIGAPRTFSVHPGGMVLTAAPVGDSVPLETAPKGVAATQFDGRALDGLGIVKLDLLGNKCLDELERAIGLVSGPARRGVPPAIRGIQDIPLADPATLERLSAGDTVGCSQIETPALRGVLSRRPIRSTADLTAVLATVRPGPAAGAGNGAGPLYEEDVMRLLASAGGMTLEEADAWRARIVGSDEDPATLAMLGRSFVRAASTRGKRAADAASAWSRAVPFARYAFSRAHASSYAMLAYCAAYMRTHFPTEYGCAVLDDHGGAYPRRTIVAEVARWGMTVRPPSVNRSGARSAVVGPGEVRLGLDHIRGLTDRSKHGILSAREREGPARDLPDLLERVRLRLPEIEALLLSGACDELWPTTADAYPFLHEAVVEAFRSGSAPVRIRAAAWRLRGPDQSSGDKLERYRMLVRARNELRYLGSTPTRHPLSILRKDAARAGCRSIADVVAEGIPEARVRVAALPAATRGLDTARGPMRFVTWEDETGLLEGTIASAIHSRIGPWFDTGRAYIVGGRLRGGRASARLEVEDLIPFERRARPPLPAAAAAP